MIRVRSLCVAFLALSVSLLGCSNSNPNAPAKISGSITYNNKPIKAGGLRFHTPNGTAYDGLISSDGTYSATDIPTGELIVTVETESINPAKAAPKGAEAQMRMKAAGNSIQQRPGSSGTGAGVATEKPSDNYMKIPQKYSNPKTSPLTVTVTSGRQVKNIELTD